MDDEQRKRNKELIEKNKDYKKDWNSFRLIFIIIATLIILYFLIS